MEASDDLMTVRELAAYLRKSPATIYRLARRGLLPGKKVGGTWRFSRRGVEVWIVNGFGGRSNGPPERPLPGNL